MDHWIPNPHYWYLHHPMQALAVVEVEVGVVVGILRVEHVGQGQVGIPVPMYGSRELLGTLRCRRRDNARGFLGAISRLPFKPSVRV